jgi:hypothetical protein
MITAEWSSALLKVIRTEATSFVQEVVFMSGHYQQRLLAISHRLFPTLSPPTPLC